MNNKNIVLTSLVFLAITLVLIPQNQPILSLSSFFFAVATFLVSKVKNEDNKNIAIGTVAALFALAVVSYPLGNFVEFIDACIKTSSIAIVSVFALFYVSKNEGKIVYSKNTQAKFN